MKRVSRKPSYWMLLRLGLYISLSAACIAIYFIQQNNLYLQSDLNREMLQRGRWNVERLEVEFLRTRDVLAAFASDLENTSAADVRLRVDILWARFDPVRQLHGSDESEFAASINGLVLRLQGVLEAYDSRLQSLQDSEKETAISLRSDLAPFLEEIRSAVLRVNSPEIGRDIVRQMGEISASSTAASFWLFAAFLSLSAAFVAELVVSQRRQRRIHAAMIQVRKADVAKVNFLANMSHELRTPLNAIIGFSDIIRSEVFGAIMPKQYAVYAADIHSSGQQLLAMVSDVLDFARIEAGVVNPDIHPFDLGEEIGLCLRMVELTAQEKMLRLRHETDAAGGARLLAGDARLFRQSLLNLLNNAITFTPQDGEIIVSSLYQDDQLRVSVKDTGIGISSDNLAKVTTAFFQVEGSETRWHRGAGLGLSIARSFTEVMGGELEVISTVGKGTSVTMIFPSELVQSAPITAISG